MLGTRSLNWLVPTKITPPQPLHTWVIRDRLLAQLAPELGTKLTLVVAPAGSGKTTLISQWLLAMPRVAHVSRTQTAAAQPVAWLTLDEYDRDGRRFLAYVAGAIEQAAPGGLVTALPLVAADQVPVHLLLQALLVDLSTLPDGLTLVLDDYHAVTAEPIHQLVAYLVRTLPPRCRLLIASRVDPPLPLARLRAAGHLTVVQGLDLHFTEAETHAMLTLLTEQAPGPAMVRALHQQTEGWAIALHLAAVQSQSLHQPHLPVSAEHQLGEYVSTEVLAYLPATLRHTLLMLAVPERFCVELCAAMLDAPEAEVDAERRVEELLRANLLVFPLDSERRWFRFHQLFRNLLLRELQRSTGTDELRALKLRAARWLGGTSLVEEAVRLFLDADDEDAAADLLERHLALLLEHNESVVRLGSWLRLVPPQLIARRPILALIEARLASARLDAASLEARLAAVDASLATVSGVALDALYSAFAGDRAALHGTLAYWNGRLDDALTCFSAALEHRTTPALASQAVLFFGLTTAARGRYVEGVQLIREGVQLRHNLPHAIDLAVRHTSLCMMHHYAGEVEALSDDAARMADVVAAQQPGELWRCYAGVFMGMAAYERSDLAAAATHLAEVHQRKYRASNAVYLACLIMLARTAALQGDTVASMMYAQDAQLFAEEVGSRVLHDRALGCRTWITLVAGDVPAALQAAHAIGPDLGLTPYAFESPQIARACALIAGGGRGRLAEADGILAGCVAESERLFYTRQLLYAVTAQALLRQAQGRPDEALATLTRAIGLAADRGLVRVLLDFGPSLRPLLSALAERGVARTFLTRVLAHADRAPDGSLPPRIPDEWSALPEMLTRREAEVLALLAQRWTNPEIAERLVIAENTVRKHTITIYGKLGVHSRREAVVAARALGLLAPA